MKPEDFEEFQRQLELEKQEKSSGSEVGPKTKVDKDGTEYDWDETKKAWFPKLSEKLLLQFQSNYGTDEGKSQSSSGKSVYTDPITKITYNWMTEKARWEPCPNTESGSCMYTDASNRTYVWDPDTGKWEYDSKINEESNDSLEKNGTNSDIPTPNESSATGSGDNNNATDTHEYKDPSSGITYFWNSTKQLWISNSGDILYPSGTSNYTFTDDNTGETYTWNFDKKQWMPANKKVVNKSNKNKKGGLTAAKRKASKPLWFDVNEEKNTNVYVSGLPPDISLEEFADFMSKCGIIMPSPHTGQPKVKLYKDNGGNLKGDGLCCYLKKESVELALQLLDDTIIRGGYRVHLQMAEFHLKGSFDPSKKPKMLSKKEKSKIQKDQSKLLDWKLARAEKAIKKTDRVIIFKNMFHPQDFVEDAVLITEIRDDLQKECGKFGPVKKVIVFDRHPDGVCSVAFKEHEPVDKCLQAMNNRWFAERQIQAEVWDGMTDYQIEETDREREERLKEWEKFLEEKDDEEKEEATQEP